MRYTDFSYYFLVAAYLVAMAQGRNIVRSGDVIDAYDLDFNPMWVHTALEDWNNRGWISGKQLDGDEKSQPIRFTGGGLEQAEALLQNDAFRPRLKTKPPTPTIEVGANEIDDGDVPKGAVPASDRIVALSHNQPDYMQVREGLAELWDAIRTTNDLSVDSDEQNRILSSLASAQSLWEAVQLKASQIKIGVVMAIEDAGRALVGTAKAVATALLVDAIKSLVKMKTGIDLDQI